MTVIPPLPGLPGVAVSAPSLTDKDRADAEFAKKMAEQARELGKASAEAAKAVGIGVVVFDRGGYRYHGRVRALAEAAREAGLSF